MSEMGSQDAAGRLFAEETAGRHLTDVVGIAIPDASDLFSKDLAANYPTPATKRILPQYRKFIDLQNRWTPWSQSEHGIAYNTNLVKNPPKTEMDLCDPRFKGKMSFDPLEVRFLVGMYEIFGENLDKVQTWLTCIAKNKPIIQRGHTARLRLMLSGDHAISPDQYFYYGTLMKKKNPSVSFGADYQTPVMVMAQSMVINKNAQHPYAAALYADWALTDESQKYMAAHYRGPLAAKHPYFPDDVKLVPYNFVSNDIVDKLQTMWKTTMVNH
jgi:iron(III) transport system substrate-binding protein